MLRVTVELVPFGNEHRKKTIGVMVVGNDGTGTHEIGHYDVYMSENGVPKKNIRVENHRRAQSVWQLVRAALDMAGFQ